MGTMGGKIPAWIPGWNFSKDTRTGSLYTVSLLKGSLVSQKAYNFRFCWPKHQENNIL